jgi:hypothetical protein
VRALESGILPIRTAGFQFFQNRFSQQIKISMAYLFKDLFDFILTDFLGDSPYPLFELLMSVANK